MVRDLKAERLARLVWLIERADAESALPGYRGGLQSRTVRSIARADWYAEIDRLRGNPNGHRKTKRGKAER